jgi:hypothetical protein
LYVRKNKRSPSDEIASISIAHNVRQRGSDGKSVSAPFILAHLGNESTIDPDSVDAVVAQLIKIRDARRAQLAGQGLQETPAAEVRAVRETIKPGLPRIRLLCSKSYGMRMLLEIAWREMGLGAVIRQSLPKGIHDRDAEVQKVFGMVWARLEAPRSKLATLDWLKASAWLPAAANWEVNDLYQTLDHLQRSWPKVEELLATDAFRKRRNDKISLVLADTTAIFTEADMDDVARAEIAQEWAKWDKQGGELGADERPADPRPQTVNNPALRMRGHSKDGHPHDPQIVMGVAMLDSGEVVSHQVFPGNTSDKVVNAALHDRVRTLLPEVALLAVMDAGMAGDPNLQKLHEQGMGWVAGMGVRQGRMVEEVLNGELAWTPLIRTSHRSRKPSRTTWQVACVPVPATYRAVATQPENLVLVSNPERARRDLRMLDTHVSEARVLLAKSNTREPSEVLHPTLRDPKLRGYVRPTADKTQVELDPEAHGRMVATVERQIKRVQRLLSQGHEAETDGAPHMLLRHRTLRHFVRLQDGLVTLDAGAVADARSAVSKESFSIIATKIAEMLAVSNARVVGRTSNPLVSDPKHRRYVRVSDDGQTLVLDEAAVERERKRAGLRVLRTSATEQTAEEILTAYDRLLRVEATFRDFKDVLKIRPMFHRAAPRIRAHVQVCVLAQRCLSWLENRTGKTWGQLRDIFSNIQASEMEQGSTSWFQRTELTAEADGVLERLGYRAGSERWASDQALPVYALPKEDAE